MTSSHIQTGSAGEKLAADYLKSHNYTILESNWRYGHKEIDIIALQGDTLCIVEVKTRKNLLISPKDSVTRKKQRHLIEAANAYILKKNIDKEVRFDIIEIIMKQGDTPQIEHIKEAFVP